MEVLHTVLKVCIVNQLVTDPVMFTLKFNFKNVDIGLLSWGKIFVF
jgi:hypothetical protein